MSHATGLPVLGDWFECVLQFLEYSDLLCSIELVSRAWLKFVESRPQLWRSVCGSLWGDKVFIPAHALELFSQSAGDIDDIKNNHDDNNNHVQKKTRELPQKLALKMSVLDSKRTDLTPDELCQFIWSIKFHMTIGQDFTSHDPYWKGERARTVRFHRNCRVEYLAPHIPEFAAIYQNGSKHWHLMGNTLTISQFPRYTITRHPINWGFMMDNAYVRLTSWEMPPFGSDPIVDESDEENDWNFQRLLEVAMVRMNRV